VRTLIGVLVSGVFIWLLVYHSGIHWPEAWRHIRDSHKWLLLASSGAATLIFAIRVPRWRVILPAPNPGSPQLKFSSMFQSIIIGQMVTNLVPGRAGEVARPYVLSRKEPTVPFSTGMASVIVDRVFDGIVVLLLLVVAMLDPAFPHNATVLGRPVGTFALIGTAALVVGLAGLFALVLYPHKFVAACRAIARRTIPRLEQPMAGFLERFSAGLTVLQDPRRFTIALLWTVAHWLVCAASYYLAYRAIGLEAPLTSTLLVQTIIVLAVALPQAPGFVGVFEKVAIVALAVYGVPRDLAAAWAIAYHVVTYIPVTALGLFYTIHMGLSFGDLKRVGAPDA
jgi:glycosyltransferase 2 family protein